MYSTAARKVASSADDAPRGGMAPFPLRATSIIESMPLAISGFQAALSPSFGALATPVLWQATQADLYSFSPAGCEVALLAAAVATVLAAGAVAAACLAAPALAGVAAACFFAFASSMAAFSLLMGPGALICFIRSSFHFPSTTKCPAAPSSNASIRL